MAMGLSAALVIWWYDMPLAVHRAAHRQLARLDAAAGGADVHPRRRAVQRRRASRKQLFDFIRMIVGRIRGGLGHVTVLAHLVFSGVSGAALADIGALGGIADPA